MDRLPFDPDDPFDRLSDELRRKVADMAIAFVADPRCLALKEADRFLLLDGALI